MQIEEFVAAFHKLPVASQGTALEYCQRLYTQRLQINKEQKEKEWLDAWNAIKEQWEWKVTPTSYPLFRGSAVSGVYVSRRVKEDLHQTFLTKHGSIANGNAWQGMFYYRTEEGILTREGGGTMVLKTPLLCSDADWAAICEGKVPERYQ